jgi:hypothetical protein
MHSMKKNTKMSFILLQNNIKKNMSLIYNILRLKEDEISAERSNCSDRHDKTMIKLR